MIAGYYDWKSNRMQTPEILSDWLNENLVALDSRRAFIKEACLRDDPNYHTGIKELYEHYERYCQLTEKQVWGREELKEMLVNMGHKEGKKRGGFNGFRGIKPDEQYVIRWIKSKSSMA